MKFNNKRSLKVKDLLTLLIQLILKDKRDLLHVFQFLYNNIYKKYIFCIFYDLYYEKYIEVINK